MVHLPSILLKLETQKALMEIALDEDQFTDAIKAFKEIFEVSKESKKLKEVKHLSKDATFLSRYTHLKSLSKSLAHFWWKNPDKKPFTEAYHPALRFAVAKLKHHLVIEKNIRSRLAEYSYASMN